MDCLSRHAGIREAVQKDLCATQRGADEIVSLLDDCSLVLAVDVAAIREAQGSYQPGPGSACPIADLDQWDQRLGEVVERLTSARRAIARLKSENLQLKAELAWQLP